MKTFNLGFALVLALIATQFAQASGPTYPTEIVKNQFGETYINSIIGGSNQIDCNFIVDSTNGNGLGIRSLKGSGCAAVYMHTSATPAAANPNPQAGVILLQLAASYNGYITGFSGFNSPISGTPINVTTGVTAGDAYVITSLGTTTAAGWLALGLPAGVTPNVGASFVAPTTTTTTGTGTIEVPAAAGTGVNHIELIGDPNQTATATGGGWVVMGVYGATSSSVTTNVLTAPANNSVIGLRSVMIPLASALK